MVCSKKNDKLIGGKQKKEQIFQMTPVDGVQGVSLCWADVGKGGLCGSTRYCHVTVVIHHKDWTIFFDPLKDVVAIPSLAHGMLGGMGVTQHRHFRNVEKCDGIKHFCKLHKKTKDVHPIYVLHGTQKESEHNCVKRCVKFIVDFLNSNMDIQTAKRLSKM